MRWNSGWLKRCGDTWRRVVLVRLFLTQSGTEAHRGALRNHSGMTDSARFFLTAGYRPVCYVLMTTVKLDDVAAACHVSVGVKKIWRLGGELARDVFAGMRV